MTPWWERLPETPMQVDVRQHRVDLNRKLRAAFVAGAEERSRQDLGRGLTKRELVRIIAVYPGDLDELAPPRG